MLHSPLKNKTNGGILVVDDSPEERFVLSMIVKKRTSFNVITAADGLEAMKVCRGAPDQLPALILLDIIMPPPDGFKVAEYLRKDPRTRDIPIIFITALSDKASKERMFKVAGADYVSKPFKEQEILARIRYQLELREIFDSLKAKNFILENVEHHLVNMVEEKTRQIKGVTLALVNALENAGLLNDGETVNHVRRVSEMGGVMARGAGCDDYFTRRLKLYAPLHDIGKIGLPDAILKKSGRYSNDEFQQMTHHVTFGYQTLDNENIDEMARNIVLHHHERWDGGGYRQGLSGDAIPLEARIISLVDTYDALRSYRPYRPPYSAHQADQIIRKNAGKHFDPRLVDVFFENKDKITVICNGMTPNSRKRRAYAVNQ